MWGGVGIVHVSPISKKSKGSCQSPGAVVIGGCIPTERVWMTELPSSGGPFFPFFAAEPSLFFSPSLPFLFTLGMEP